MAYKIRAVLEVDNEYESLEEATQRIEQLWETRKELVGFAFLLAISVVVAEDGTPVVTKDIDGRTDVFT